MFNGLTPKQEEFIYSPQKRINILSGSVSSGKTYCSLIAWGLYVAGKPKDTTWLMAGKTQTTLKRNCLSVMQQIFGETNFSFSMSTKTASLFGHLVYLEGADNERAEDKIRGITLDGAYLDEATLMPESFFTMLLSRLRKAGAFVYATTNPDNPMHWLKVNYIDRAKELDCAVWDFKLDDNTYLPKDYVENIKKEYTGVFYRRFIDGEWVIADGLVISAFDEARHWIPTPTVEQINTEYAEKYIGIDYGISNPTAYTLWAYHKPTNEWHCLREYYYGGRDTQKPKTDPELYTDLVNFSAGINGIDAVVIDPSASSFIVYIQKKGQFKVRKADNEVLAGISFVNTCFAQDKARICDCCVNLRKELYSYAWDTDKSRTQGKDVVIKENDHLCITGETEILTENGWKMIKNLVGTTGRCLSYNTDTEQFEVMPFKDVRQTSAKEKVYKLTASDGKSVRLTANHPVLTDNGYRAVCDLNRGDHILAF